jgi:hypothetical protein
MINIHNTLLGKRFIEDRKVDEHTTYVKVRTLQSNMTGFFTLVAYNVVDIVLLFKLIAWHSCCEAGRKCVSDIDNILLYQ